HTGSRLAKDRRYISRLGEGPTLQPVPGEAFAAAVVHGHRLAVQLALVDEAPVPAVEAAAPMIAEREHHAVRHALRGQVRAAAVVEVQQRLRLAEARKRGVRADR